MADDSIAMQDIFVFERTGIDESGKVRGMFRVTGVHPQSADRLATAGARLRPGLFDKGSEEGDAAGVAVKKPRSPNLNRGSAAASLDQLFG